MTNTSPYPHSPPPPFLSVYIYIYNCCSVQHVAIADLCFLLISMHAMQRNCGKLEIFYISTSQCLWWGVSTAGELTGAGQVLGWTDGGLQTWHQTAGQSKAGGKLKLDVPSPGVGHSSWKCKNGRGFEQKLQKMYTEEIVESMKDAK